MFFDGFESITIYLTYTNTYLSIPGTDSLGNQSLASKYRSMAVVQTMKGDQLTGNDGAKEDVTTEMSTLEGNEDPGPCCSCSKVRSHLASLTCFSQLTKDK